MKHTYGAAVRLMSGGIVSDGRWRDRFWFDRRRRPGGLWARRLDVGLFWVWITIDTQPLGRR